MVVVFCDLRGYTLHRHCRTAGGARLPARISHGALGPLISQFEGTLDQFSGDGIVLFFNDPIPDPAERAVKTAVAMRDAAGALISARRERGRELGFGVGIAQGLRNAVGTECNVAARLCGEAKHGQILLSQRVNGIHLNPARSTLSVKDGTT